MPPAPSFDGLKWKVNGDIPAVSYQCAYCETLVSSEKGYRVVSSNHPDRNFGGVTICPKCQCPTFHYPDGSRRVPDVPIGKSVNKVPPDLNALYEEARTSASAGCYTGAVLLLRKMLMNIAVNKGAEEGLKFIQYVEYLAGKHYVPPGGEAWVDHIRKKGNEATHEITTMTRDDAQDLIVFVEMLLRFIYEFPSMITQ